MTLKFRNGRRVSTNRSSISCVFTTASRKYVINPMSAVFHLLAIFVKVVEPAAVSRDAAVGTRREVSRRVVSRRGGGRWSFFRVWARFEDAAADRTT